MADTELNDHLQPLARFVGKTWRGEFASSTPDKPMVDVSRWERALNGNAVRIVHSVNEGQYGGETILMWDSEAGSVIGFYFTTSGFYTRGRMTIGKDHFTVEEDVTGNSSGVTKVKSTSHLGPDGSLRTVSQYFKKGSWVEGHEITYHEAPDAEVVFQ